MNEPGIETEVKFRVTHLAQVRADLIAHGAIVTQQRHLERNTLFDDSADSLKARDMLLRLRDALDARLTLKAPAPPDRHSAEHKARVELETSVGDYDAAFAILIALGYSPGWRYEKYREAFRLGEATIALDHTPIGDFVEIEAPASAIRATAETLGFDWSARNVQTYRQLFEAAGRIEPDMTFDTGQD